MRRVEADSPRTLRGVPLVQLAAVHAAVAEGFPLDEVLALEVLPPAAWFEAEVSWKARLVSDSAALDAYRASLADQQDRLTRRVKPLADDLEAWIHFLQCYATHPDPCDLLVALGLCLNDMARLGRGWETRFANNGKLAKQAAKLSLKLESRIQRGDKPRLPLIEVLPATLCASPAAGSYRAPDDPAGLAADLASVPLLGLDQYAALSADLRIAEEKDRDAVLLRHGITARDALLIDEAWRARLHTDRELFSDFRVLVAHYEQGATLRKRSAQRASLAPRAPTSTAASATALGSTPASASTNPWLGAPQSGGLAPLTLPPPTWLAPLPIVAPPESLPKRPSRTAPGVVMAKVHVLPFEGKVRSLPPIAEQLPPRPPRREGDIDATTDTIPALLDSEVMPFETPSGAEESALAVSGDDLDGTMMLGAISFDDEAPLPFMPSRSAAPDMTVLPESFPRREDAHSSSDGATVFELPLFAEEPSYAPALPLATGGAFETGRPNETGQFLETGLDTSASWVISISDDDILSLDTTGGFDTHADAVRSFDIDEEADEDADLDATTLWRVLEGLDEEAPSTPERHDDLDGTAILTGIDFGLDDQPTSEPFAAAPPSQPCVSAVDLTLDQLASLHAELSVTPARAASIRTRYGLTGDDLARCEARWRARFEHAPHERVQYQHKLASFRAWLLSRT